MAREWCGQCQRPLRVCESTPGCAMSFIPRADPPPECCLDAEMVDVSTMDSAEDQEMCLRCHKIQTRSRATVFTNPERYRK